ncbi:MAG TPA: hypothetical protein VHO67_06495 [Polyangia bacterium]|nr:hypothetical protein [Polyangia bacterium]
MTRATVLVLAALGAAFALGQGPAAARAHRADARTGKLVPAMAELVKARKRGDRTALGRVGDRIGPARLAAAIAGADARIAEAAMTAAPETRAGVLLIGTIADQVSGPDARARAAVEALGRLLDGSRPAALEHWEVPPDDVARACAAVHGLAGRTAAPLDTRLQAIDASLAAAPTCGVPRDAVGWARDSAPEIRRAAVLLAAAGTDRTAVLRQAIADGDQRVSAAAVAADCRVEARNATGRELAPDPQAVAAARSLVAARTTAAADAVEMLDCLAAAATPADRALLESMRRGPPSPLRDRAVELIAPRHDKGTD